MQIRQGDVLLDPTDEAPVGAQAKAEGGRVILARGEATGHHHSIAATPAVALFRPDDMPVGASPVLVITGETVRLEHQEHDPIPLAPGRYRQLVQVEETPEAIRRVED